MAAEPVRWTTVIRLAIVVEGETEEEFVRRVLANYLHDHQMITQPIKSRGRSGPSGGTIRVERLASQMRKLRWNFDAVTSLFDLYGFQGREEQETVEDLEHRIDQEIERISGRDLDRSTVFAYIQKHEFEGLLFSEVSTFSEVPNVPSQSIEQLHSIRAEFPTPEDIDDGPNTAPSKRIKQLVPGYRKRLYGPIIAEETGLTRIREECPRFDVWVSRLESLAQSGPTTA